MVRKDITIIGGYLWGRLTPLLLGGKMKCGP